MRLTHDTIIKLYVHTGYSGANHEDTVRLGDVVGDSADLADDEAIHDLLHEAAEQFASNFIDIGWTVAEEGGE